MIEYTTEEIKELEKSEEKKGFKWTNLEQVFEIINKQQARIDKAIKYIEEFDELVGYNNEGDSYSNTEKKLLDILKGE